MKKFRIIRFMGGWAIEERFLFFFWSLIRHGDYWFCVNDYEQGNVMSFQTKEDAEDVVRHLEELVRKGK